VNIYDKTLLTNADVDVNAHYTVLEHRDAPDLLPALEVLLETHWHRDIAIGATREARVSQGGRQCRALRHPLPVPFARAEGKSRSEV
jgi:hypothetical protein